MLLNNAFEYSFFLHFKEYVIYTDRMLQTDTILLVAVSVSNFFFRNRVDVNILR